MTTKFKTVMKLLSIIDCFLELDLRNSGKKSGIKINKNRNIFLFAVNKSGSCKLKTLQEKVNQEKVKVLDALKHVNMVSLPISYRNTKNAWMTSDVFTEWFQEDFVPSVKMNLPSIKHKEKALFILDHYSVHPPANLLK